VSDGIRKAENFMGILAVLVMIALIMLQVVFRYVLGSPLAWTEELNRLAMVWLSCVGSAIAMRERAHVQIDVLYERMSAKVQKMFRVLGHFIVIPFSLFMVVYGTILVSGLFVNRVGALGLPLAVFFIPLPMCGLLFLYHVMLEKPPENPTKVSID